MERIKKILAKSKVLAAVLAFIALLQGFFGDPKWQYYPLYILGAFYLILFFLTALDVLAAGPRMTRWLIGISLFLVVLTVFSMKAFPVLEMLEPTGDFEIGTQTFELEDLTRKEVYSEDPHAKRRIKYQVWYPAESTEGLERVQWLSNGTLVPRTLLKHTLFPVPPFLLDQTAEVVSHSYTKAPLRQGAETYPVIVISHGWRGFRELHTDFAEDLASHGYIVLSIDHTYGSEAVAFEDGSVAYLEPDALPRITKPSIFSEKAQQLAVTYGKDVEMVLDELERLNEEDDTFKGQLDLDRIGLLGHSTGGAGDVFISLQDERVQALIGLDAWVNPLDLDELKEGLKMPALFLRSEQWGKRESKIPLNVLVRYSKDAQIIEMEDTKHLDFPMIYMLSPFTKKVGLTGKKGGRASSIIQRELIRMFFDDRLRDEMVDPDDLESYLKQYEHLELWES